MPDITHAYLYWRATPHGGLNCTGPWEVPDGLATARKLIGNPAQVFTSASPLGLPSPPPPSYAEDRRALLARIRDLEAEVITLREPRAADPATGVATDGWTPVHDEVVRAVRLGFARAEREFGAAATFDEIGAKIQEELRHLVARRVLAGFQAGHTRPINGGYSVSVVFSPPSEPRMDRELTVDHYLTPAEAVSLRTEADHDRAHRQ